MAGQNLRAIQELGLWKASSYNLLAETLESAVGTTLATPQEPLPEDPTLNKFIVDKVEEETPVEVVKKDVNVTGFGKTVTKKKTTENGIFTGEYALGRDEQYIAKLTSAELVRDAQIDDTDEDKIRDGDWLSGGENLIDTFRSAEQNSNGKLDREKITIIDEWDQKEEYEKLIATSTNPEKNAITNSDTFFDTISRGSYKGLVNSLATGEQVLQKGSTTESTENNTIRYTSEVLNNVIKSYPNLDSWRETFGI
ncbi:hypothetical protein SWPG_00167 [Synechococcus phage S-CBM2]|nr:hypothetical protein SWPG_00167 [Synechococcus phage S-CBM2]